EKPCFDKFLSGHAKVDPEVTRLITAAARAFESDLCCDVEAADPGFDSPWNFFSVLWITSCFQRLRTFLPEWEGRMAPDLVAVVKQGERLDLTDYAEALVKRTVL